MTDATHNEEHPEHESTGSLIARLARGLPELIRKEMHLLRAEISEKTNQAFTAVGLIVGGLVFALVALNVLAAALVAAIAAAGVAETWSAVIVGGGIGLLAFLLAMKGVRDLKASRLMPERTVRQAEQDAKLAKETLR
jgi:uncharacterized membrane protein YqjE